MVGCHSDGERDVSVDEGIVNGLLKMQKSTSVLSLASLHDDSSSNNLHALDLASSGNDHPYLFSQTTLPQCTVRLSLSPCSSLPLNIPSHFVSSLLYTL